jgi:tetratricopeptide (TPR) repeat protein
MANGSGWLWVAVARFAEQQGDWTPARAAWEQAAGRDGADRVASLVAASVAANLAEDEPASERLLASARELNPNHPRVLLQDVDVEADIDTVLGQLKPLFDETGDVAAIAHAQAALSLLMRGELGDAETHLAAGRAFNHELMPLRIVAQNLIVQRGRLALSAGEHVDARALAAAKDECLGLREELIAMRRWGESVRVLMLAADATALQWELQEAGRLLLSATDEERDAKGGRIVLADAALRAQQSAAALELLEGVPRRDVEVLRATAEFHLGDEAAKRRAMEALDRVISSNSDDALRAAMVRATRSAELPNAGWSDDAERVLTEGGMAEAALASKTMWLHARSDGAGARQLLQPHRQNVRIVELLMGLAVLDNDKEEAARVAVDLLALGPDNLARLRCARALYDVGDVTRAKAEAVVVADDPTAAPYEQGGALYLLAGIAADDERDFTAAMTFFERWAEVEPDNERHVWGRVLALTRLARHADALKLLENTHVYPVTLDDARLAASVYARMEDPVAPSAAGRHRPRPRQGRGAATSTPALRPHAARNCRAAGGPRERGPPGRPERTGAADRLP